MLLDLNDLKRRRELQIFDERRQKQGKKLKNRSYNFSKSRYVKYFHKPSEPSVLEIYTKHRKSLIPEPKKYIFVYYRRVQDYAQYEDYLEFKQKRQRNQYMRERVYTVEEFQSIMKNFLEVQQIKITVQMFDNFSQNYQRKEYLERRIWRKNYQKYIQTVHLEFKCPDCPNNQFPSICGTLQICYLVEGYTYDEAEPKPNPVVTFGAFIYEMQCKSCLRSCKGLLHETQMEQIIHRFNNKILDALKGKIYETNFVLRIPDIHWHKTDLCQACKKKKCVYQKITKEWSKFTRRQNGKIIVDLKFHQMKAVDKSIKYR